MNASYQKKLLESFIIVLFLLSSCVTAFAGTTRIVPDQYLLIQGAIDVSEAGDTVLVKRGVYDQGEITMKDGVNLIGQKYATVKIIGWIKITTANNVQLKDLIIEDLSTGPTGTGILVESAHATIKNVVVHMGNHTSYDRGIYLNGATDAVIENNTVHIDADAAAAEPANSACIYSNNSTYTMKNNILTLNDSGLNAINANSDTPSVSYNCIVGKISPVTLEHKNDIFGSPSYKNAAGGDFHLALPAGVLDERKQSISIARDAGDPASDLSGEEQIHNHAVDIGAYGNTCTFLTGDCNGDGSVDFNDINPFVSALVNSTNWKAAYPYANFYSADCDLSGTIDFNDINPFVSALVSHSGWKIRYLDTYAQ